MKSGDSDDAKLFDLAVKDVKRLQHDLAAPKNIRPLPISLPLHSMISIESKTEFGEELRYLRPGIQTSALQKLRRGQFPIEETLDLHGLKSAEAATEVEKFLHQSESAGRCAVRIVHGKGYGSAERQPVLKTKVQQLLQQSSLVLAFCSSRERDGGTGAVDILLRKPAARR